MEAHDYYANPRILIPATSFFSLLRATATLVSHWALILVFTALYRLSPFHPLAKYPGPVLGKLSKFYLAYLAGHGDAHTVIRGLHQQYGDVVRVGPNELSFNRVDALQPIYAMKSMPKGPCTTDYNSRVHEDGSRPLDSLQDFSVHAARRKPWTKAMSPVNSKNFDPIIVQKARELMEELAKHQGQPVNIAHWMMLYGYDFMGHLVFGREFGMLKAGKDNSGLIHGLEHGLYSSSMIAHIPWSLPILQCLPIGDGGSVTMQRLANDIVRKRQDAGSHAKDIYYYLVSTSSACQELLAEGLLAIIAGADTTAVTLCHFMYFMMRHPECADSLRREVDAAFPHGDEPTDHSRLANMPYLNACINETLRLLPPVLTGLQREVQRGSDGAMIGPYFVPGGTPVSIHVYSLHRNPEEFSPLPDTFWPERWLTRNEYTLPTGEVLSKDQVVTNRAAFVPFSFGPQNCAGKALASVELRVVISALVQKFEVRKAKEYDIDDWEKNLRDHYVTLTGPLQAVLTSHELNDS
ncbi:hypothetical protein PHLGIDRAFT_23489 [Phlebiopsis gigantea 11061_1 CR5-6]|uniref:Cytochrome P450 n=1 Tax=Phlebiopsis gigantea (strain 11061_1 CR5-6) TaxID=745531 RepID=A0A0C3PNN7_PHLG1|nr:hypothetical protein PHLGIDRAFT_23489 [Phlebiopsis gigantea 11061_1 CR5-6]